MTELAFIRHGRTAWNESGRLTGRADIPLTAEGEAQLVGCRVPDDWAGAIWHTSPLQRARQTAALLGHADARVEQRLIEMDFGAYEGQTIADLRQRFPREMAANEDRGLDFLPPDGESPRMVLQRLRPFLYELAATGGRHIAVAHKSVIRSVFAAAYYWPMLGPPPIRLQWNCAHAFSVDDAGAVAPLQMNIPLLPAAASNAVAPSATP